VKIPVAAPALGGNEEKYLIDALRSTWISSSGPYLERFEQEFADLCHTQHSIAVSNGTVALHLALLALGVGPGDEVIVPSLTYVATANAVRYVGADPVFVDVDERTWCLDAHSVGEAITARTRAVIAVHLYGQPADMAGLRQVCGPRGVRIVEDAAEAPLAWYNGKPTGGLGDVATFSFYGNKLLSSGEGGAVTVNDDDLANRIRLLRGQGMDSRRRYWFPVVGYNYRLTNLAAALLCAQLERRDEFLHKRWDIYARYERKLTHVPGISFQAEVPATRRSPWLFSILVGDGFPLSRDTLMERMAAVGIETRPFFPPIHRLPPYLGTRVFGNSLPVTDRLADQGMNLPTYVDLPLSDVDRICDVIGSCRENVR
jgi:perosamine synthetase